MKTLSFKNISMVYRLNNVRYYRMALLLIVLFALFGASCKKDNQVASVAAAPVLSASASNVVLSQINSAQPALSFNWTAAALNNSTSSVTYFLQWDLKGNNFANVSYVKMGNVLTYTYTQGALNALLSVLPPNIASTIEIRLVAASADGAVDDFYSNVVTLTVTPYTYVPPPYNALWMVGDATPNGWNIGSPNPMLQSTADGYIFTYTGALAVGEFKIPVTTGNWGALFYRPAAMHPPLSDTRVVLLDSNSGDNKWYISQAGTYVVTLNLHTLTISIVKQ